MSNLQGPPGELRFTVQITRKQTGKVEEVELIGHITADEAGQPGQIQEQPDGRDPLDSSPQRGD